MSNFIPMLSSSPPPLDDSGGFDDWEKGADDEDFGGFASAVPGEHPESSEDFGHFSSHSRSTESNILKDSKKVLSNNYKLAEKTSTDDTPHSNHNGNGVAGSHANVDELPTSQSKRTGLLPDNDIIPKFADSQSQDTDNFTFQAPTSLGVSSQNSDFKILPSDDEEDFADFQQVGDLSGERTRGCDATGTGSSTGVDQVNDAANDGDSEAAVGNTDLTSSSMSGTASIDSASHESGEEVEDLKQTSSKCLKQDTQDNTSQDSVTDSGLCSDISPITKFEDYPDFGEAKSMDQDPGYSEGPSDVDALRLDGPKKSKETTLQCQGPDQTSPDQEDELGSWGSAGDSGDTTPEVKDCDIGNMIIGNKAGSDEDPEPLCLKPPEFTGDEETVLEALDDSFGQFDSELTKTDDSGSDHSVPASPTPSSGQDSISQDFSDSEKLKVGGQVSSNSSDVDIPSSVLSTEQSSCTTEGEVGNSDQCNSKDDEEYQDFSEESTLKTDISKAAKGPDDEDDDDFGDFRDDNDDEFGDFADVDTAGASFHSGEQKDPEPFEDGGGFAAFGETNTEDSGGNWAAFSETAPVVPSQDADDEEFEDFEDVPVQAPTRGQDLSTILAQSAGPQLSQVVLRSYPASDVNGNHVDVDLLPGHVCRQVQREQEVPLKPHMRHRDVKSVVTVDVSVWNNLKDLEKTAALKYQWNKSSTSSRLLRAIAIDTRNILMGHKKHPLPVYASHLGLLEPSREPRQSKPNPAQPTAIVDTGTKPPCQCPVVLQATTPQDIPPAEFDWGSSGLTNPLDSSNIQLDLDFFIKNTINTPTMTSPTAALENELLKSIEPLQRHQPKTLEPLENILANMKFTPTALPGVNKRKQQEENFSQEAGDLVTTLPSLTFMKAKVLMFPLKDTSD